jgi:S-DNA-T family DNA segregation ATPase FtsK/SpoIIIE
LQIMMDRRYAYLLDCERRKVVAVDTFLPYVVAIDEFAYFSATVGKKQDRDKFSELLRDLVARGRAVGIIVVAATQRPSSDIIPTSLRDQFAWRFAGRCTTNASSDIILGHGWAQQGWSSNTISPTNPGAGLLIAEDGSPKLVKVAYLDDATCAAMSASTPPEPPATTPGRRRRTVRVRREGFLHRLHRLLPNPMRLHRLLASPMPDASGAFTSSPRNSASIARPSSPP